MLKKHEQHQVHDLLEVGLSVAEVARRTGKSLGTIYKYKQLGRNIQSHKRKRDDYRVPAELASFSTFLDNRIKKSTTKPRELYFELQREGYIGSRKLFEEYYRQRNQDFHPFKRTLKHLETEPGEEAQVDWAHFGQLMINGRKEKVFLFIYALSWSRAFYGEFVVHQNQKTLQACHMHAFEQLGIPRTILYDNMKTVVNKREKLNDDTKKIHYNEMFLRFAQYYHFQPAACSPRWPQAKGKVESDINYVRRYFSRCTPKLNITLEELNQWLARWIKDAAHQREHRTTQEKPADRWLKETSFLSFSTNLPPYNLSPCRTYYATEYGVISYKSNFYNLGPTYARKKLDIREIQIHGLGHMEIYHKDVLITTEPVASGKHRWISVEVPDLALADRTPLKSQNKTNERQRSKIEVEQRNLSYYNVILAPAGGISHG